MSMIDYDHILVPRACGELDSPEHVVLNCLHTLAWADLKGVCGRSTVLGWFGGADPGLQVMLESASGVRLGPLPWQCRSSAQRRELGSTASRSANPADARRGKLKPIQSDHPVRQATTVAYSGVGPVSTGCEGPGPGHRHPRPIHSCPATPQSSTSLQRSRANWV